MTSSDREGRERDPAELATLREALPGIDPTDATVDLRQTIKPTVRLSAGDAGPEPGARAAEPQEPQAPPPDGYQLLDVLGRGGMGVVYRARQAALERDVAVKRLLGEAASPLRNAFLAESIVTGELEHPNVVPVYALCEESGGELWLVMKRIGGHTLAELLTESPAPRARETVDRWIVILLAVGDALRFAHSRGILHRDVKPENVMVGAFGEVLLLDWGVAARFGEETAAAADAVPHVSSLQQVAGTPRYMAPEQALGRGDALGPWTDVFLLGATLHEMLAGAPPHSGANLYETLAAACRAEPPSYDESVPEELQAICRKALARDPAERYRDVAAFQAALREYLEHRESRALAQHAELGLERWRAGAVETTTESRARRDTAIASVIASFQHARYLWPDNEHARAGEERARIEWARDALRVGELGVVETALEGLAGGEVDDLRRDVASERARRRRALRLVRGLGIGLIALQAAIVVSLAVFGAFELERFTREEIVEQLERIHRAVAAALAGAETLEGAALDAVTDALGRTGDLRIELVDLDGRQLAHSHDAPGDPSPLAADPAVAAILAGRQETAVLHLPGEIALIRAWRHAGNLEGALVTALPSDILDGPLHAILVAGLAGLLVSFLLFSAVAARLSRRLTSSLERVL